MKCKLSIVVPCYNEEKNIPLVLDRFKEAIGDRKDVEVILVDNNSKDNTQKILKETLPAFPFARSVFQPKPGYGAAVYRGLQAGKGEFLCWTHGDIQTPPKDTLTALDIIVTAKQPKKTYVKGNRYGRSFIDQFFTIGMSVIETVLFMKPFWDINAQPNVFHKSFLQKWNNPPDDFSLDLYSYYIGKISGYAVIRFDVHFGKRFHGTSAWNTGMKARFGFIKRTLKFSWQLRKKI